jgi:integrase
MSPSQLWQGGPLELFPSVVEATVAVHAHDLIDVLLAVLQYRADAVWRAAGLERITLHERRHTFASIAIAAGVNIGTVSAALGHASVTITWDRYHHLMPGTMDEAASLIQAYVERG